jgi:peptidoglycan/LPS O-acetylase OafA/YrhL
MHSVPNQFESNAVHEIAVTPASRPGFPPGSAANSMDDFRDLANLDILRTVAVSLVFCAHLAEAMKIRGLGDVGQLGVLIFFVHTSLVLMLSMGRIGLSGFRLYFVFLVRRVFRIYPLSILAVLAVITFRIPAVFWIGGFERVGWRTFFSNIFLTQNLTHSYSILSVLWSLPFEMQMYFLLPVLYLLLTRFPSLKVAFFIWLLAIAVASAEWALQHGNANILFLVTPYVPCFLAGVFAWRIMATKPKRLSGFLWIVFLLLLVVAFRAVDVLRVYGPAALGALQGAVRTDHQIWWPHYLDLVRNWAFCSATGVALPFFRQIRIGWLNGLSRNVALYSYGIYVAHLPVMWLCFDLLHLSSLLVGALLSIALTAAFAILLYHLLEHPAIEFGKRLSTNGVQLLSGQS